MMKSLLTLALMTGVSAVAGDMKVIKTGKPMKGGPAKHEKVMSYTVTDETQCEGHQIMGKFQGAVAQQQGAVDMVNLKNGIAHFVVCPGSEQAKAVHAAGEAMDKSWKALMQKDNPSMCQECLQVTDLIKSGQMTDETLNTAKGAMWLAMSDNAMVVKKLHDMNNAWQKKMTTMKRDMMKAEATE